MQVLLLGGHGKLAGRYKAEARQLGHELTHMEKGHPATPADARHKLVVVCMSCCSHPQRTFALNAQKLGARVALIEGSPSASKLRSVLQRELTAQEATAP